MRLLAIDGNSVLNRAYYGIRLLSTKDGRFTNGITGFMNILLNLLDSVKPDAVCAAFDLKAPTFRHELFEGYKAGRHAPPPELIEQFAPLKELLRAMGFIVLEKEGYEADDFLGALSALCGEGDFCAIATGDRDSLQLVSDNCTVLLASTKMGQSGTDTYDKAKILEEYHVTPPQLIDIKALMGDSSDNIPGVKGIGQKGAVELIEKYGSIRYIYDHLDSLDIRDALKEKLRASREDAFKSYTLGTVLRAVPGVENLSDYTVKPADGENVRRILSSLEMFRLLGRLSLTDTGAAPREEAPLKGFPLTRCTDYDALTDRLLGEKGAYFLIEYEDGAVRHMVFNVGGELVLTENADMLFPAFLENILSDARLPKFVSHSKPLFALCEAAGVKLQNIGLDTSLAGYLLNPNASDYAVGALAAVYKLPAVKVIPEDGELAEFFEKHGGLAAAAVLPAVCQKEQADIRENGQEKLLFDIEIPLAGVLASMEREGFAVDAGKIREFGGVLSEKIDESLKQIYSFAGEEFNVNSPKQLGDILFSPLKLSLPHGKKTKNGYSTDANTLDSLKDKHPIVSEILEYRTLSKLKSTYCDGLLKVVGHDGRIHSTLNQTETRTGRISSTEPNLQNIPVRRELGRELRRFFVAEEGNVLIDADYSQIELRVLAALAGDETMLNAFQSGDDIHTITASQVFGVPVSEVTPLLRGRAKAVNFGIVYGIGAFSLSADIGVSVAEADRYIKSYLAHYAGVAAYMERMKRLAKERGYAETLFLRRRYLPELSASNANVRNFGERVAMNMPIQGTAADIIKIAMVRVHERLLKEGFKAKLILQVHDELLVEAPENEADRAAALLKEEMESACDLKVHLRADIGMGKSWYDSKN